MFHTRTDCNGVPRPIFEADIILAGAAAALQQLRRIAGQPGCPCWDQSMCCTGLPRPCTLLPAHDCSQVVSGHNLQWSFSAHEHHQHCGKVESNCERTFEGSTPLIAMYCLCQVAGIITESSRPECSPSHNNLEASVPGGAQELCLAAAAYWTCTSWYSCPGHRCPVQIQPLQ